MIVYSMNAQGSTRAKKKQGTCSLLLLFQRNLAHVLAGSCRELALQAVVHSQGTKTCRDHGMPGSDDGRAAEGLDQWPAPLPEREAALLLGC